MGSFVICNDVRLDPRRSIASIKLVRGGIHRQGPWHRLDGLLNFARRPRPPSTWVDASEGVEFPAGGSAAHAVPRAGRRGRPLEFHETAVIAAAAPRCEGHPVAGGGAGRSSATSVPSSTRASRPWAPSSSGRVSMRGRWRRTRSTTAAGPGWSSRPPSAGGRRWARRHALGLLQPGVRQPGGGASCRRPAPRRPALRLRRAKSPALIEARRWCAGLVDPGARSAFWAGRRLVLGHGP